MSQESRRTPATQEAGLSRSLLPSSGLDLDRFKADIQREEVVRRIAADQDRGESLGIDRTPWENRPGRAGQANNPQCRSSGLTTPSIEAAKVRIFSVLPGSQGRFERRPKKTGFFCCTDRRNFRRIAGNQAWPVRRPDITLGASVQNILKKMKKRLVSPLKPR